MHIHKSYIKHSKTLSNTHILHITTPLNTKHSSSNRIHVVRTESRVLAAMRSEMQQSPRTLACVYLDCGNKPSNDSNQPREPPNHIWWTTRDNHARATLKALHTRRGQILVQSWLQQMHKVLVAIEGVSIADVLRIIEAKACSTARGGPRPNDTSW